MMKINILSQLFISSISCFFVPSIVAAQLVPDNRANSTVTPINEVKDRIEGGTTKGSNLFHSFQEFNVGEGREVLFANPTGIDNILTGVSGNNASRILGTLGVEGAANLFLINPNGIIFGNNASLNLNGSFLATTAEEVVFGDRGSFDVTDTNVSPLLTINPSALLFNQINSGTITNRSTASAGANHLGDSVSGLRVADGKSLLFASPEIILDGGNMNALGGNIGLIGTKQNQSLALQFNADNIRFNILNKEITGKIEIKEESEVNVSEFGDLGSGLIQIAAKKVVIKDSSLINADTFNDSQNETAIDIRAAELTISQGAQISASIQEGGIGKGGNLRVSTTDSVTLIGTSRGNNSGNNSSGANNRGNGNGNGGGNNNGSGNNGGGDNNSNKPSKLASDARGTGQGGHLILNTNRLILQDGAKISASATENSQGGNIEIDARESIELSGGGTSNQRERSSAISTQAQRQGKSGLLSINTNNLTVAEGAEIIATTFGDNSGGDIKITANESISVTGVSPDETVSSQIVSETGISRDFNDEGELEGTGDGGNIELVTENLTVDKGAFISANTLGFGNAGDLTITTHQLTVADTGSINVSAKNLGEAGSLTINAGEITLNNGSLNAETRRGSQGNITLNNADTLLLRNDSQITTNASEQATGGDITITSDTIGLLDGSDITAKAEEGRGGNILITTQGLFQEPNSTISAESRLNIDGTITINNPDVDPTSEIVQLSDVPIDAEAILAQNLCKFEDEKIAKGSSFIITGRGGLTPTSEASLGNVDNVVEWANTSEIEVSNNGVVRVRQRLLDNTAKSASRSQSLRDRSIIQQSQGWVTTSDGDVWLVANSPETIPQNEIVVHPNCQAN